MPILAKIVLIDGRVSGNERAQIGVVLSVLGYDEQEIRFAVTLLERAGMSPEPFETCVTRFAQGANPALREVAFLSMAVIAGADGQVPSEAIRLLRVCGEVLGFTQIQTETLLAAAGIRSERDGGQHRGGGVRREPSREEDLALLGLAPGATDEAIRRAYRTRAKALHPDRLQAQGAPPAMLKQASEHFAVLSAAYRRLIRGTPE